MSYFFALEVPEETRTQIAAFAQSWQSKIDPLLYPRWVVPEDYHITLNFLGHIPENRIAHIINLAAWTTAEDVAVVVEQKPSILFPIGKPQVLWIEIIPSQPLRSLASSLGHSSHSPFHLTSGRPEHRPYKPHITLARCQPNVESGPYLVDEQAFVPFTALHFVLMQTSTPEQRAKEGRPRYNIVQTFPFGTTPAPTQ